MNGDDMNIEPNRTRRRPSMRRCIAVLAAVALLLAGIFALALRMEEEGREQERGVSQMGIGQRKRVEYQGKTYIEKLGLTTILVMGVDRPSGTPGYGARQGGQADFQMLMVIDSGEKRIKRLQIDRDTMTEVEILGILGNVVGTQRMQICLAHGFGNSPEENCEHAVSAVENLLEGVDIELYMAMDMDAIGTLNHALGGVTVTLTEDFSAQDPAMMKGTTLCLDDRQAEIFVRSRMSVGDGTNASRMVRHRTYMNAAAETLRANMEADSGYINGFLDEMEGVVTTNISRGRMINEVNKSYRYETPEAETLPGEYRIGEDGFMEYHVTEGAVLDWIMRTLYEPQE